MSQKSTKYVINRERATFFFDISNSICSVDVENFFESQTLVCILRTFSTVSKIFFWFDAPMMYQIRVLVGIVEWVSFRIKGLEFYRILRKWNSTLICLPSFISVLFSRWMGYFRSKMLAESIFSFQKAYFSRKAHYNNFFILVPFKCNPKLLIFLRI